MIRWPMLLADAEAAVAGPEDEFDERCNGDPDSLIGEEDDSGFDEMSPQLGWEDEGDDEDDETEGDGADAEG